MVAKKIKANRIKPEKNLAVVNPQLIHLNGIRVLKAHIEMTNELMDNPEEIHGFSVGAKSESGFNLGANFLRFRLFLKINGMDKNGKSIDIKGEYVIEFHYEIENLKSFAHYTNKDDYLMADIIGATIAGISYSTARGIILERTLGTDFDGVILPVIDPKDLLQKDTFTKKSKNKRQPKKAKA